MFSAEMLSQMIRFYGTAMQGMIGQYLEQNVQAFLAIQKKLQDQAKQIYGDKLLLTPDLWKQFMQMQAPAMQGMSATTWSRARSCSWTCRSAAGPDARHVLGVPLPRLPRRNRRRGSEEARGDSMRRTTRGLRRVRGAGRPGRDCAARTAPSKRDVSVTTPRRPTSRPRRTPADARPPSASSRSGARRRSSTPSTSSPSCAPRATTIAPTYEGADLVVVNTCGFIDAAVDGVARRHRRGARRERQGDRHRVPRRQGTACVREAHPTVLAVTGPHATPEVMAAVHAHLPKPHDPFTDLVPPQGIKLTPRHYAYLKISEGCNHRCTFCIIPSMRGDLVSRPVGEVMREAEHLRARGREGAARHLAGHERLRRGREVPHRLLERQAAEHAHDRARAGAGRRSAPGCACTTSIRTRTSTR